MVKCPLTKKKCLKEDCALWVKLVLDQKEDRGNCAFVWNLTLLIELRMANEQKTK